MFGIEPSPTVFPFCRSVCLGTQPLARSAAVVLSTADATRRVDRDETGKFVVLRAETVEHPVRPSRGAQIGSCRCAIAPRPADGSAGRYAYRSGGELVGVLREVRQQRADRSLLLPCCVKGTGSSSVCDCPLYRSPYRSAPCRRRRRVAACSRACRRARVPLVEHEDHVLRLSGNSGTFVRVLRPRSSAAAACFSQSPANAK